MNVQDEIKALKERISESEELIAKLEQQIEKEQEFPRNGDTYWIVDDGGDLYDTVYTSHRYDEYRKKVGNIYKTESEAEFASEKLKVEAELREFSRPFEENGYNSFIELYMPDKALAVDDCMYWQKQGVIYFESDKKAQQAIDAVGEDRIKKYIFGMGD